jgi:MFS family permease
VFLYSVAGFTVASMLCGLAQSLPQIVLARLLHGLCGAALVPLSQAVLLDINPPERLARAMAVWVMGAVLGLIIGPALGGWLTENYNWRWVFYINVPFGILAFLGILSFLPETAIRKSPFDFFGFTALSVAIAAFQIMLDRGQFATASDTARHIALGREIVGNWWALLRSDAIDQLVKQAVEHNRRLVASKATLAQAQELALARFDM